MSQGTPFTAEMVPVADLKPHPRNYRQHPDDQLDHIVRSIELHGFYRNVVVARDNTILAGHGVVQAVKKMGGAEVPVIRLDVSPDDPAALKVLVSDNEIGKLAEVDDRALTEMLKSIVTIDPAGLLGTGFDEKMLAALVMVTRPASEIASTSAAAHWVGMPEYEVGEDLPKLVITFESDEDRKKFAESAGLRVDREQGKVWSTRWPWTDRLDSVAVRFETGEEEEVLPPAPLEKP